MKLPACPCHRDLKLTAQQHEALVELLAWVDEHGAAKLSSSLIRGGTRGNKINNDINFRFKALPTDLRHLSKLRGACHLAGVEDKPGMLRSTSLEEDLALLRCLYHAGERVSDAALQANEGTRKLWARLKKRVRAAGARHASWASVVLRLQEIDPSLDARRFFHHLPGGYCLDRRRRLVELRNEDDRRAFAVSIIREIYEDGLPVTPGALQAMPEVGRLLRRVEKGSLVPLISEATGLPPEQAVHVSSGARIHRVGNHSQCCGPDDVLIDHLALRSNAEAAVDECLAAFYGSGYERVHRHDVPLAELVADLDYGDSPYTGNRSPDVDVVFPEHQLVVEISHRSDVTRPGYREKLDWKISRLRSAGWTALALHVVVGREQVETARAVLQVLRALGHEASLASVQAFLTSYKGGKLTRYSFEEAKTTVRTLGISTSKEYQARYREDPSLPGNPNTAYAGEWLDWYDFLGAVRPELYVTYAEAHKAVQGRFDSAADYRRRHKEVDPKLLTAPEEKYRDTGWLAWAVFLGQLEGLPPPPPDLHELVSLRQAARELGLSEARVSQLQKENPSLRPAYVRFGAKRGEDRCLYRQAEIDAYRALPDPRRGHKLAFEELQQELQRRGVRDTKAYELLHRERLAAGDARFPVSPTSFYPDFVERGGWRALFGLPGQKLPDDPMTPEEVAAYLGRSRSAVAQWRKRTPGLHPRVELEYAPRGVSRLVYSKRDVDAFARTLRGWGQR